MDQGIRRILVAAFIVATAAAAGVVFFAYWSKSSATYGQQCVGAFCWGYRLDQSRFVEKTTLTFWNSSGLKLEYHLPPGRIVPVDQDRWLGKGRAIYLNFRIQGADANGNGEHVRLVYDFERGTLHVSAPTALWRNADLRGGEQGRNWLTDDQLDAVLIQIDPTM